MCLIIAKAPNDLVPESILRYSFAHNNDGFGIMAVKDGRIEFTKGLFEYDEILKLYHEHRNRHAVLHFRFATQGTVNVANCHPIKVLGKEEHGMDLFMCHNGMLRGLGSIPRGSSDTVHLVNKFIRPELEKHGPSTIFNPRYKEHLADFIGPGNKLVFLSGEGKGVIINEEAGQMLGDSWYSNLYSVRPASYDGRRSISRRFRASGRNIDFSSDENGDNRFEMEVSIMDNRRPTTVHNTEPTPYMLQWIQWDASKRRWYYFDVGKNTMYYFSEKAKAKAVEKRDRARRSRTLKNVREVYGTAEVGDELEE